MSHSICKRIVVIKDRLSIISFPSHTCFVPNDCIDSMRDEKKTKKSTFLIVFTCHQSRNNMRLIILIQEAEVLTGDEEPCFCRLQSVLRDISAEE